MSNHGLLVALPRSHLHFWVNRHTRLSEQLALPLAGALEVKRFAVTNVHVYT